MAKLQIKKSNETGKVPQPADLDWGELAINYTDGKLFYKKHGTGTVELLNPDTNTVTRLRGTSAGTYTSGDLTLVAGTNITITQSGSDYTIASAGVVDNTKLPLAGGTLTGSLVFSGATGYNPIQITGGVAGYYPAVQDGNGRVNWYWNKAGSGSSPTFEVSGEDAVRLKFSTTQAAGSEAGMGVYYAAASTAGAAIAWTEVLGAFHNRFQYLGNTVLHAGNYSSYALPLSGGTMTGQVTIGAVGSANSPTLRLNTSTSAAFVHTQENLAANLTAGQHAISVFGKVGNTKNSGYIGYYWAGDASNSNFVTIGHWGNDDLFRVYADGAVTVGTNTVLHANNYNSYSPTLTGTGASGSWAISVTGTSSNVTGTVAIANGGTAATTAAGARTNLGANTVGSNLFTLANPDAITFLRINADNTVSTLDASAFRTAIGAGTVTLTDTQTLSNKYLTDDSVIFQNYSDTTRKAYFSLLGISPNSTRIITLPDASTTLVGRATTDTLTNKTFTDNVTFFQDNTDNSKKLQFELSSIATSTTRTLTVPNASGTIALASTTIAGYGITDAYTKTEVDGFLQGLDPKASVRVATTANITLSGAQTIDGIAVVAGDRVLVKDQTAAQQNGIYIVAAGVWTRAPDMDAWAEIPGSYVFTEEGTAQADFGYVCTSAAGGTLDTTAINWVQFNGAANITAGTGLTKSGNTLSVSTVPVANGGTGATTAAAARTNLGANTVGGNLFTLANPSAITFLRVNADNTVSTRTAAEFRSDIGAGTGNGSVTSVGGTGTVAGLTLGGTVTSSGNLTLSGTLSTPVSTINDSTTVGQNLVKLTNPSAVTFLRVNADNTVTARTAAEFRSDIGAGTSSTTGTVTSVGGTGTVAGLTLSGTVTSSGNLTLSGTLSTPVSTINDSTTVGQNLVKLTNPSAVTFLRVNADNTVSTLDAATFRTAIGSTSANTASTIVARDASGNFSAGTISANEFIGTFTDSTTFFQDNVNNAKKMQLQLSSIIAGSGATVTYTVASGGISSITAIPNGGANYKVGDILTIDGYTNTARLTVSTVTALGAITAFTITTAGTGYSAGTAATTTLLSTIREYTIPVESTTLVGIDTVQTLSNKYLMDDSVILQNSTDTTKKAYFSLLGITGGSTRIITLPDASTTLVGRATTDTLTNKTFTDSTTFFQDNSDNSKKLQFELSSIATSTTRTLTIPNASGTIALASTTIAGYGITDAYTKTEVDGFLQGLDPKASVRVATTANITLSGTQTIDGIAVVAGDRVLVKDQTSAQQNGIYVVAAGAWTRAVDMNAWAEFPAAYVFTEEGSTQADFGYVCTVQAGGTLETTAVTWIQFNGAANITAGTGLTKSGNTLSVSTVPVANGGTGATTAAGARTNLGANTVGSNLFTLANPSAITFLRVNADNTVSTLDAATFRTAIGAGTLSSESDTLATVTSRGASTSTASTFTGGITTTGITVSKSGTDSTITFPAQTNDPGYIKHYENNNTAVMYFNVSDDANDFFYFGYSADSGTFRLRSDGVVTLGTWQGSSISTTYTDAKITSITATSPIVASASTGAVALSHAASGVGAGTYNNVTVNATGHVTSASNVSYLVAEADTLATVTGRGATTSTAVSLNGGINIGDTTAAITTADDYTSPLLIKRTSNSGKGALLFQGSDNIGTAIEHGRSNAASHWGTYLAFLVHDDNTSDAVKSLKEKLRINATGVGINVTNPSVKLDIQDTARSGTNNISGTVFYATSNVDSTQYIGQFRHQNQSQGIGFSYNSIRQTGSNTNEMINLCSRGTGDLYLRYGSTDTSLGTVGLTLKGTTANVGIGTTDPSGRLHVTSSSITAAAPNLGWPVYNAEADTNSRAIYIDTAGNGSVSTAGQGATVSLILGQYYDSRVVITPSSSGGASPSDQGAGRGKDLMLKAGTSDNGVGYVGGRLYLSGGMGYTATGYNGNVGNLLMQPFGGNVGIGTTPSCILDVNGSSAVGVGTVRITNSVSGGANNPAAKFINTRGNHSYGIVAEFVTNTAADTDRPSILFYGAQAAHSWQLGMMATNNFHIGYRASNTPSSFSSWPSSYVIITSGGNVGIGTSADPTYKLEVNGSFAATTKSFVIDHPTKPGKKLRYGSLEGPENGVYIRGRLRGTKIELPEYWTKLVDPDSITVQLTPHGRRQDIWVTKIENNCVYVQGTTQPDCYYLIQAERVDVEKLEVEIGN